MKRNEKPSIVVCSDCAESEDLSRRGFLRSVGAAAAAVGAVGLPIAGPFSGAGRLFARSLVDDKAAAKPDAKPAETFVKLLYDSLTPEQRKVVCMPFDHEKRSQVNNNWHIVPEEVAAIGKFYTADQQELIRQILKGVTSEDGYERFQRQMQDDAGGFDKYTCAIFGEPGTGPDGKGKFEWVMTGRHLTIRADGNSVENTAFGGPIFYGHAVTFTEKPDHAGNVWWHQARLANQVYQSLDGKQREKALLAGSPADDAATIALRREKAYPGLPACEMSSDQKKLLEDTFKSLLSMYRESDVCEVLECVKKNGGLDTLSLSFYQEGDLGDDGIWDRWMVRGPALAWYFRGSPHVHTWVNIAHAPLAGEPAADPAPSETRSVGAKRARV
jgi:hypothetical protein